MLRIWSCIKNYVQTLKTNCRMTTSWRARKPRRLDVTNGAIKVPDEPNARTGARWRFILASLLRYIDDGSTLTRVNFESNFGVRINAVLHHVKHAVQAQNVSRHLVRCAEEIGTIVNSNKMLMLCISDSLAYEADAFLYDSDQT